MQSNIKPDNERQCNVVPSLTGKIIALYENPQTDNDIAANIIGEIIGKDLVEKHISKEIPLGPHIDGKCIWNMDTSLSMVFAPETECDCPDIVRGTLYEDEQYGYYSRTITCGCNTYYSTFRFSRDKMKDVVRYVLDNSPASLEEFLKTLDGYEWIEQEHG